MNEVDENGWGHIHHAAFRGFIKSVEKFVAANGDQLELETSDELSSTPLLLAVMSGNLETVQCLFGLGARLTTRNTQRHGIVELACMRQSLRLLDFFYRELPVDSQVPPVIPTMVKLLGSRNEDECEHAASCFRQMLAVNESGTNQYWEAAIEAGIVPTIVKVIKSEANEEAKTQCFLALLHIQHIPRVIVQFHEVGGLSALVTLLKANTPRLVQLAARVMGEVCDDEGGNTMEGKEMMVKCNEAAVQAGAIPALVRVAMLETPLGGAPVQPEVLQDVMKTIGIICQGNEANQIAAYREQGFFHRLAQLYENCQHKGLLIALTRCIGILGCDNPETQGFLLAEGLAKPVIYLTRVKAPDLQLVAVETLSKLAENNQESQQILLDSGAVPPLLNLLKTVRGHDMQEYTAGALWNIAGTVAERQHSLADGIGVLLLVDFVHSTSNRLNLIGSQALAGLCQGPMGQQDMIGQKNGIPGLVRLLRSDQESIVLAAIRTLRLLCTRLACVPHTRNQSMVVANRGLRVLVALMVKPRNEIIRAEAALALAACAVGNHEVFSELENNPEFNFIRILNMLNSPDSSVRLAAGSALATFSYNNLAQQRAIASQGGVRYSCLLPFLRSANEMERCEAAYQVVVLSRIIPDEEQAISSAAGIKLLVDLLQLSKDPDVIVLAADFVARLAHSRAGLPQAIVSIGAIPALFRHVLSSNDNIRGCAAIALAYLTYNHNARRQMLKHCRQDPYFMEALIFYSKHCPLDPEFLEGWKHCKRIGLPPIKPGRPQLTTGSQHASNTFMDPIARQVTSLVAGEEEPVGGAGGPSGGQQGDQGNQSPNPGSKPASENGLGETEAENITEANEDKTEIVVE